MKLILVVVVFVVAIVVVKLVLEDGQLLKKAFKIRIEHNISWKNFGILPNGVFIMVTGLKLPAPVGVNVGVDPKAVKEAIIVGGSCFGISNPRNFKLTNLHAMLNSLMFILPSRSVSASALQN